MATNPEICIKLEANSSKFTIIDETGETVVNFNDNGYGTPNPDRNSYATVLVAYYQPYEGDKSLITNLETHIDYDDSYDNSHKSSIEVPYSKDGWYEFNYILVPTSVDPEVGSIIYSTTTNTIQEYDSNFQLVDIEDSSKLLNADLLIQTQQISLYIAKLSTKKNELSRAYFACKQCIECGCEKEYKELSYLRQGLESAVSHFLVSRFEAQLAIERLTKQYKIK